MNPFNNEAKYELSVLSGKESGITKIRGGFTIIDRVTGRAKIIIDGDLSHNLQAIYLRHEVAQLAVIQTEVENGRPFSACCRSAHQAGMQAGIDEARQLNALDEYLTHRGVNSVEELIEVSCRF